MAQKKEEVEPPNRGKLFLFREVLVEHRFSNKRPILETSKRKEKNEGEIVRGKLAELFSNEIAEYYEKEGQEFDVEAIKEWLNTMSFLAHYREAADFMLQEGEESKEFRRAFLENPEEFVKSLHEHGVHFIPDAKKGDFRVAV